MADTRPGMATARLGMAKAKYIRLRTEKRSKAKSKRLRGG